MPKISAIGPVALFLLIFPLEWAPAGASVPDRLRACGLVRGETVFVREIVDGDTVALSDGRQVRLVGLQAPKLPLGRKGFEPWPLGEEAREQLDGLVRGKAVQLLYGGRREDRHGRILAHLLLDNPDEPVWIEEAMLLSGHARVYSFADNRACIAEMLAAERIARDGRHGIWADPFYRVRDHRDSGHHIGSFQLVEGTVLQVAEVRGVTYVNFGDNWRNDFTISVSRGDRRRFGEGAEALSLLEGRKIRVRGWLNWTNGPMITVTHPEQIEMIDGDAM